MNNLNILFVNLITFSRIFVLLPLFFTYNEKYLLFSVFWVAISDFLDGFFARKLNAISSFGIKFDQYADKIVTSVFLVFFLKLQQLSFLFVNLLLMRELLTFAFRHLSWSNKDSNFLGKAKTFFLYTLFIYLGTERFIPNFFIDIKMILMFLAICFSWLSFFLSISKLSPVLIYSFGTTGLSAILVKKAPGTITSLLVFLLLFFGLINIDIEYKISLVLLLLVIHFVYYSSFLKQFGSLNDDPNIYTLDETLAIAVAWLFLGKLVLVEVILLFALFRFFDIFKPLGIYKIEKIMKWSPAIRNLADDILAITYAIIIFQIIKIYE